MNERVAAQHLFRARIYKRREMSIRKILPQRSENRDSKKNISDMPQFYNEDFFNISEVQGLHRFLKSLRLIGLILSPWSIGKSPTSWNFWGSIPETYLYNDCYINSEFYVIIIFCLRTIKHKPDAPVIPKFFKDKFQLSQGFGFLFCNKITRKSRFIKKL